MKSKLLTFSIMLLLILSILGIFPSIDADELNISLFNETGVFLQDYSTLQQAIDNSSENYKIRINKNLTCDGNITVTNLEIYSDNDYTIGRLNLCNVSGIEIHNLKFENQDYGIYITDDGLAWRYDKALYGGFPTLYDSYLHDCIFKNVNYPFSSDYYNLAILGNMTYENMIIHNCIYCIDIKMGSYTNIYDTHITFNNFAIDNSSFAINFNQASNFLEYTFKNFVVTNTTGAYSLYLESSDGNHFSDSHFDKGYRVNGCSQVIDNCTFGSGEIRVNYAHSSGNMRMTNCTINSYYVDDNPLNPYYAHNKFDNIHGYCSLIACTSNNGIWEDNEFIGHGTNMDMTSDDKEHSHPTFRNCSFTDFNVFQTGLSVGDYPLRFINCIFTDITKLILQALNGDVIYNSLYKDCKFYDIDNIYIKYQVNSTVENCIFYNTTQHINIRDYFDGSAQCVNFTLKDNKNMMYTNTVMNYSGDHGIADISDNYHYHQLPMRVTTSNNLLGKIDSYDDVTKTVNINLSTSELPLIYTINVTDYENTMFSWLNKSNMTFSISGLESGKYYTVLVDSVEYTEKLCSDNKIIFNYNETWSKHEFQILSEITIPPIPPSIDISTYLSIILLLVFVTGIYILTRKKRKRFK